MDFFRDAKMSLKKVSFVCFQDYFKTTLLYIYNVVLKGKHLLLRTHESNSPYKIMILGVYCENKVSLATSSSAKTNLR